MGYYVDHKDGKEKWLVDNGTPEPNPAWPAPADTAYVCLVDNGKFRAAGIAFDHDEFLRFMSRDTPEFQRPRWWWIVSKEKLLEVSPVPGLREALYDV